MFMGSGVIVVPDEGNRKTLGVIVGVNCVIDAHGAVDHGLFMSWLLMATSL